MPCSFTHRYVFASAGEPIASAMSPTRHGIAQSFMAILLGSLSQPGRRDPDRPARAFAESILHPAEEPERSGAVFALDLLGVGNDDGPDTPKLADRVGVIVDADVVIPPRLTDGGHQERGRLLAALVAAGGLARFEC